MNLQWIVSTSMLTLVVPLAFFSYILVKIIKRHQAFMKLSSAFHYLELHYDKEPSMDNVQARFVLVDAMKRVRNSI